MFAIDSVKWPNNASKHRSGTRAEFTQRAEKLEAAAQTMLDRHRATDALELEPDVAAKTTARMARDASPCVRVALGARISTRPLPRVPWREHSKRCSITRAALDDFRTLADHYAMLSLPQLNRLIAAGDLEEFCDETEK